VLVPVVIFIVWLGVYPKTFLDKSAIAARSVVHRMEEARRGGLLPPVRSVPRSAEQGDR